MKKIIPILYLLLPTSILNAYTGTVSNIDIKGWTGNDEKCVLYKKIQTTSTYDYDELIILEFKQQKMNVIYYAIMEEKVKNIPEKDRDDYEKKALEKYHGRFITPTEAKKMIGQIHFGDSKKMEVKNGRVSILNSFIEYHSSAVAEAPLRETGGLIYTIHRRILENKNGHYAFLLKEDEKRESIYGLSKEKLSIAVLSPRENKVLMIINNSGNSKLFSFYVVDLSNMEIFNQKIYE